MKTPLFEEGAGLTMKVGEAPVWYKKWAEAGSK